MTTPTATTRRIAILPDAVADQIAAGEVVERPASVVKELVENSLDAGARNVRIEIETGGKTLVRVSDDGTGMGRDDAVLALDRHATSKLTKAADLVGIATFGFRGEAVPAIASVSRMTLSTAEQDGAGVEISVNGGRMERVEPIARQQGTTVTVRTLFFNTPARRKFLRSTSSETRACHEAVLTLALAHPEAGFSSTPTRCFGCMSPRGNHWRSGFAPRGDGSWPTPWCRWTSPREAFACMGSRSAPRMRDRPAGGHNSSSTAARSATISSCAPPKPGIAPRSTRAIVRRCTSTCRCSPKMST